MSIVACPGFQKFFKILCPHHRLPHRNRITEVVDEIAGESLSSVKETLVHNGERNR